MYFNLLILRLISIMILLLSTIRSSSQVITIEDMLSFQNLKKDSLESYIKNKGYKLEENTISEPGYEKKSFKFSNYLDRIHFSALSFDVNNIAQITSITYEFNRNIIYHNLFSQINNLKFKLKQHAEGDFGTDIYVFVKDKIEIHAHEQPEGSNSSCEGCTYFYISIYFK
jgi:hypothetical protein